MVSVGIGDELCLTVNTKLPEGCLDMISHSVSRQIKVVCNTVNALVLIVELHDPQLSIRKCGVEPWHTDDILILALPSERTCNLLEVEHSIRIVMILGVKFTEITFQEPADTKEVVIHAVEATLGIAFIQSFHGFRIVGLYPTEDLLYEGMILFCDFLSSSILQTEKLVVTNVKFSLVHCVYFYLDGLTALILQIDSPPEYR